MKIRATLTATSETEFGGKIATIVFLGGELVVDSLKIEHGAVTFKILISDIAFEQYKLIRALGK